MYSCYSFCCCCFVFHELSERDYFPAGKTDKLHTNWHPESTHCAIVNVRIRHLDCQISIKMNGSSPAKSSLIGSFSRCSSSPNILIGTFFAARQDLDTSFPPFMIVIVLIKMGVLNDELSPYLQISMIQCPRSSSIEFRIFSMIGQLNFCRMKGVVSDYNWTLRIWGKEAEQVLSS